MLEVTYKITAGPDKTFNVEVFERGVLVLYGASGFRTEADAAAWIKLKRARAPSGQEWALTLDRKEA